MSEVYVAMYGAEHEGNQLLGVFSDYISAREFEVNYRSRYAIGESGEWVEIRKVELNKLYEGFAECGEEV
jgi:hypothetical protein